MRRVKQNCSEKLVDVVRWYNGITDRSESDGEFWYFFITEFRKIVGNSITKRAMVYTMLHLNTDNEGYFYWKWHTEYYDVLANFKKVRRKIKKNYNYFKYLEESNGLRRTKVHKDE